MKEKYSKYVVLLLLLFMECGFVCRIYSQQPETRERKYELRMPDSLFLEKVRKDKAFDYKEPEAKNYGLWRWWERLREYFPSFRWNISDHTLFLLLKIAAVCLLLLTVYGVLKNGIFSPFGRKAKVFSEPEDSWELPENIDEDSYRSLLEKALEKEDYVLAVRWQFLYLLHWLDEKKLIKWEIYKTNADYIRELKNKEHARRFRHLSYIFDCVCYGKFEINEVLYRQAEAEFLLFRKEVEA